ncbi:serine/threonine protein kinase [Coemansia sp. Benny D160-2]|nr:serine/threonine protein kinase [Coemansia sp. Benny D160-2]
MMQNHSFIHGPRAEISPATTLSDGGSTTAVGAQGKKKFAHFRRLFSSLHKRAGRTTHHGAHHSSKSSVGSASTAARHAEHAHGGDDRENTAPTSSTVILRRPSTASASAASTRSDEAPVISDRYTGYIVETYGAAVRTIGQGTGGFVRLHQACDGRFYAVKTFTFADGSGNVSPHMNVRQWKHLLDEASFSLSLQHPNVIRTYQFVREDDGTVYSIMEYCEKDLFTVVQEGALTPAAIDRLFAQLVSGVAYLHDVAHVAHRDMKLDNLCVDEEGNLKIIDFGCSSTFDPMAPTQTRGICGSDPYIAPEVFAPRAVYDPRKVDVWALGVIYLAMVSGHFPWEVARAHDPNYALYLKYHGRVIDHWLPATSAASPVVKAMLSIDPADRPTIDAVVSSSWITGLRAKAAAATDDAALAASPVSAVSAVYAAANPAYSSASAVSSGISISSGY